MGKLIVIEGLDGSGKSTQLDLLPKNLETLSFTKNIILHFRLKKILMQYYCHLYPHLLRNLL